MRDAVAISKRLAFVLRHDPGSVGLALDPNGWVDVEELLASLAVHGFALDRATLEHVVATSPKRRFELAGHRIRAAQGHSVPVELGLPAVVPPDVLFHGTVARFVSAIRREGLVGGSRTHVHLSGDRDTARAVGARRGEPVILVVDSARLHRAGHEFFQAANGVWLTRAVPPTALRVDD